MSFHIAAEKGSIAEAILLPGDPLRAKFIAENYLEEAKRFNDVRNMFGYTGRYKGAKVSVMGTGMGIPSHSIYVNELIKDFGVRRLARVGTCGGIRDEIKVRDLVLAIAASTDSAVNKVRFKGMDYAPAASFRLLRAAAQAAEKLGLSPHVGPILSSDSFYADDPDQWKLWARFGILAIEMEAAELYTLAAQYGAEAIAILTVSDHLITGEATTSEEREKSFRSMVEVGLGTVLS